MKRTTGTTADTGVVPFADLEEHRRGPVRRYLRRHPAVGDWLLVGVYLITGWHPAMLGAPGSWWLPVAVLLAGGVLLLFRRRFPVTVLAVLTAGELLDSLLTATGANPVGVWITLYTVAVVRSARFSLAAGVLASLPVFILRSADLPRDIAEGIGTGRLPPYSGLVSAILYLLACTVAVGVGITVRRDRQRSDELHQWAVDSARLASANERTRIAREMHDIVAHSLSVMIALSDGAGVVLKKDPQRADETLRELSATGRAALTDMRRVLGVLKKNDGEDAAPLEPVPGETAFQPLVERFRAAGLPVRFTRAGSLLPKDPAFQLAVYRILQESLTNALRYAANASLVDVKITSAEGEVTIAVIDDGQEVREVVTPGGAGRGIAGITERAAIYDGTVRYGPRGTGGWIMEATLAIPGEDS